MKKYAILALFLFESLSVLAQPPGGRRSELGLSGGYESYSTGSSEASSSVFLFSPRYGYFVYEGLEIEGEAVAMVPSPGDIAYQVSGNLSYNFPVRGRALGFVLAGYGAGNTIPVFGIPSGAIPSTTVSVLNLGAGMKILAAENVAVRVEGRWRKFSGEQTISYPMYQTMGPSSARRTIDVRIFSVLFGLSLFF